MTQKQLIDQFCKYRGKCTTDDVVALNFAYKMLTSRWISVEDELPMNSDDVLVCNSYGYMRVSYYHKVLGRWSNCDTYFTPTHWMPLPAISCSGKPNNHFIGVNKMVKKGGEE